MSGLEYLPLALPVTNTAAQLGPGALTPERAAKCLGTTEGKDKILKLTQFSMRFMVDVHRKFLGDEDTAKRCEGLWKAILDARNFMWWGKSFNEWQTIKATLKQLTSGKTSQETAVLNLTLSCRVFFMLRWVVENIKILGKFKFLPSVDGGPQGQWNVKGKWLWFFATLSGLAAELIKLQMNRAARAALSSPDPSRVKQLDDERTKSAQSAVAFAADSFVASNVIQLPRLLGIGPAGWSDLAVGLAGSTSSTIQLKNLWPA